MSKPYCCSLSVRVCIRTIAFQPSSCTRLGCIDSMEPLVQRFVRLQMVELERAVPWSVKAVFEPRESWAAATVSCPQLGLCFVLPVPAGLGYAARSAPARPPLWLPRWIVAAGPWLLTSVLLSCRRRAGDVAGGAAPRRHRGLHHALQAHALRRPPQGVGDCPCMRGSAL